MRLKNNIILVFILNRNWHKNVLKICISSIIFFKEWVMFLKCINILIIAGFSNFWENRLNLGV